MQQSAANTQQNGNTAEEARAAKEATEVGKATLEMTREIRNKRPQEQANAPLSHAAAAARGVPLAATYNTQSVKQLSAQTQREVIMNIRDPLTVQSLRAMNPMNLSLHVQRAIAQSGNENIANVKIVSSNQLKSGDLTIRTASSNEVEALRQFADDWDCPSRTGESVSRKCAACRGEDEAWSRQCPTRKDEIAKARAAYEMRPRYHHVSQTAGQNAQLDIPTSTIRRRRPSQPAAASQPTQPTRNRSRTGRGQKRTNAGTNVDTTDQEIPSTQVSASQRPRRQIIPTRRALEATGNSARATQNHSSYHMEIDSDNDA